VLRRLRKIWIGGSAVKKKPEEISKTEEKKRKLKNYLGWKKV